MAAYQSYEHKGLVDGVSALPEQYQGFFGNAVAGAGETVSIKPAMRSAKFGEEFFRMGGVPGALSIFFFLNFF